jgi:putative intracellular protease/amidase
VQILRLLNLDSFKITIMTRLITLVLVLIQLSCFSQSAPVKLAFVCPPCNNHCDELEFDKTGTCAHCGMKLILKSESEKLMKTKKKIAFYLQDGVEILDFAGPMEVFAYAGYEIFTVSKTKEPIKAQRILKVTPDYSIADAPQADILAFFGGNSGVASEDADVINWVKSQKGIQYYFSVCTGAFILGEAGLLKGRTATTFHNALDGLEKKYPETKVLKNARFVDNGNVITTAGISAGIDGALHLVTVLDGVDAARKAAYYMEYDKWIPGEGIILTENNPYKNLPEVSQFQPYTGFYEFPDGSTIQLKINEREKALYAVLHDRNYLLFFKENNKFSNLDGDQIMTFTRDKNDQVVGYKLLNDENKIYKKIK